MSESYCTSIVICTPQAWCRPRRAVGKGVDKIFGLVAAGLRLLGYVAGNLRVVHA